MKCLLACLLCLAATAVHAEQQPAPPAPIRVHVHQEPAGALMQGETARVVVDVLTTDFFTDAPALPELHVDGAYLSLSAETPGHLVETIDGQTWSGVSRTYLVTPLMSGAMEIPSFAITAHLGAQRSSVTVQTEPLSLQVKALVLPAGVSEALIARALKITQVITPEATALHVGDTVTRRIEISAEGAPAMMLPPSRFAAVDGLTLYPASPVVGDAVDNHGGFVGGHRVDTASYVIEHRGRYSLPPLSVRWMDSRTHEWHESSVPAVYFHAWWGAPNKPRFALPQRGFMPRLLGWFSSDAGLAVLSVAALAALAWYFRAWCARQWHRWQQWRYRRRHREAVAFRAVRRADGASAAALAQRIDAWVRRAAEDGGPASIEGWVARYGGSALGEAWDALQDALYGSGNAHWSVKALIEALVAARQQWRREHGRWRPQPALPPLNPVG